MKKITENQVQNIPITIKHYNSFWKRLRGLMFRKKPLIDEGILLTPCNSIHMMFMFFPIDVVFVDGECRVIYVKEDVRPWSAIFPVKNAESALELPAGTIAAYSIKAGDSLVL